MIKVTLSLFFCWEFSLRTLREPFILSLISFLDVEKQLVAVVVVDVAGVSSFDSLAFEHFLGVVIILHPYRYSFVILDFVAISFMVIIHVVLELEE